MSEDETEIVAALARAAGLPANAAAHRIGHGMSGDLVFRLEGARAFYAKVADPSRRISVAELAHEVAALAWLDGRAGAPRLVWCGEAAGRPAMITEAADGVALHALAPEAARAGAIAALAALARLHTLPIAGCPLDQRLAVKLAEAERRMAAGEIDLAALEGHNAGASPRALWRALLDHRPTVEDLVVTHGDACWPNFILRPDGAAAIIDLGRFGVADRHHDLALFIRSARHNFPDLPVRALVEAHYRAATLDEAKLEFYQQLDEFF